PASCARGGPPRVAPWGARGSGSPVALPPFAPGPSRPAGGNRAPAGPASGGLSSGPRYGSGVVGDAALTRRGGEPRGPVFRLLPSSSAHRPSRSAGPDRTVSNRSSFGSAST